MKRIINQVHLWMGLSSGLILFVVCLSGTVYTFRSEVERLVEPRKYYAEVKPGASLLPADSVVAAVLQVKPGKVTGLVIPSATDMNWQVTVKNNAEKKAERSTKASTETQQRSGKTAAAAADPKGGPKPKTYFVNPYTGQIAGEQGGSTSDFFTKVMQLHRWLLMEDSGGKIIVGAATVIFVFIIISGLVLWFPAKLRLIRQGLTIRTSANWKRINHDLHNTLGFYSFLVLLVMALTGLCWSFEWYRDGLGGVLGAKVFRARGEKPMVVQPQSRESAKAFLQQIVTASHGLFEYSGNLRLSIPESDSSAVTATKSATGFFANAGADKAQFDPYSGEALKVERFSEKPLNVQIADSIRPLHTGEMFGTLSKIIYFITCLIATSLPVTGTLIWVNKMKKKNKKSKFVVTRPKELA